MAGPIEWGRLFIDADMIRDRRLRSEPDSTRDEEGALSRLAGEETRPVLVGSELVGDGLRERESGR